MTDSALPASPRQKLPRAAYTDPDWFEREKRTLFADAWILAGVATTPARFNTASTVLLAGSSSGRTSLASFTRIFFDPHVG